MGGSKRREMRDVRKSREKEKKKKKKSYLGFEKFLSSVTDHVASCDREIRISFRLVSDQKHRSSFLLM